MAGRRRRGAVTAILLLPLLLPLLLAAPTASGSTGGPGLPYLDGDWVIPAGSTWVYDEDLTINGSIILLPGASLEINGGSLILQEVSRSAAWIRIGAGASIQIDWATVRAGGGGAPLAIEINGSFSAYQSQFEGLHQPGDLPAAVTLGSGASMVASSSDFSGAALGTTDNGNGLELGAGQGINFDDVRVSSFDTGIHCVACSGSYNDVTIDTVSKGLVVESSLTTWSQLAIIDADIGLQTTFSAVYIDQGSFINIGTTGWRSQIGDASQLASVSIDGDDQGVGIIVNGSRADPPSFNNGWVSGFSTALEVGADASLRAVSSDLQGQSRGVEADRPQSVELLYCDIAGGQIGIHQKGGGLVVDGSSLYGSPLGLDLEQVDAVVTSSTLGGGGIAALHLEGGSLDLDDDLLRDTPVGLQGSLQTLTLGNEFSYTTIQSVDRPFDLDLGSAQVSNLFVSGAMQTSVLNVSGDSVLTSLSWQGVVSGPLLEVDGPSAGAPTNNVSLLWSSWEGGTPALALSGSSWVSIEDLWLLDQSTGITVRDVAGLSVGTINATGVGTVLAAEGTQISPLGASLQWALTPTNGTEVNDTIGLLLTKSRFVAEDATIDNLGRVLIDADSAWVVTNTIDVRDHLEVTSPGGRIEHWWDVELSLEDRLGFSLAPANLSLLDTIDPANDLNLETPPLGSAPPVRVIEEHAYEVQMRYLTLLQNSTTHFTHQGPTVLTFDRSPALFSLPDRQVVEDELTTWNAGLLYADPDDSWELLNVSTDSPYVWMDVANGTLSALFPHEGPDRTVGVTIDDGLLSVSGTFVIQIIPINDVPQYVGTLPSVIFVSEEEGWSIDLGSLFDDEEDDAGLHFQCTDPAIVIDGSRASWAPSGDYAHLQAVEFRAIDGADPDLFVSSPSVELVFEAYNDPPHYIDSPREFTVPEDTTWTLDLRTIFVDPEDDPMSFTSNGADVSDNAPIWMEGPFAHWSPDQNSRDLLNLIFSASDGLHDSVSPPFTLDQRQVNDPPTIIGSWTNRSVERFQTLTLDLRSIFTDEEDALDLRYGCNDAALQVSPHSGMVTYRPDVGSTSLTDIACWANDSHEQTLTPPITIRVTEPSNLTTAAPPDQLSATVFFQLSAAAAGGVVLAAMAGYLVARKRGGGDPLHLLGTALGQGSYRTGLFLLLTASNGRVLRLLRADPEGGGSLEGALKARALDHLRRASAEGVPRIEVAIARGSLTLAIEPSALSRLIVLSGEGLRPGQRQAFAAVLSQLEAQLGPALLASPMDPDTELEIDEALSQFLAPAPSEESFWAHIRAGLDATAPGAIPGWGSEATRVERVPPHPPRRPAGRADDLYGDDAQARARLQAAAAAADSKPTVEEEDDPLSKEGMVWGSGVGPEEEQGSEDARPTERQPTATPDDVDDPWDSIKDLIDKAESGSDGPVDR